MAYLRNTENLELGWQSIFVNLSALSKEIAKREESFDFNHLRNDQWFLAYASIVYEESRVYLSLEEQNEFIDIVSHYALWAS